MQEIHRVCWGGRGRCHGDVYVSEGGCCGSRDVPLDSGTSATLGGGDGGEAARRLSLRRIRLLGGEDGMGRRAEVRRACREESGDIFSAR